MTALLLCGAGAKRDLYTNAANTSAAKIAQGVSVVNSMIPPVKLSF
jgi:hypothetical protein